MGGRVGEVPTGTGGLVKKFTQHVDVTACKICTQSAKRRLAEGMRAYRRAIAVIARGSHLDGTHISQYGIPKVGAKTAEVLGHQSDLFTDDAFRESSGVDSKSHARV